MRELVRSLYKKTPEIARYLAATILKYSDLNNCPYNSIDGPQPELENNITQATKRKSTLSKDLSYQPPKPAKIKAERINSLVKSG